MILLVEEKRKRGELTLPRQISVSVGGRTLSNLSVVELERAAVVDLVVVEGDVVLEHRVPLLEHDLLISTKA